MDITKTKEISSYISKLLRDTFGKGPEGVYISFGYSFVTIYIRNLLSPTDKILMEQEQEQTIDKTRDIVFATMLPEIKTYIKVLTGLNIREFYYDWSLHNRSAMVTGIMTEQIEIQGMSEHFPGKEEFHKELTHISVQAEKAPDELFSYKLNDRTLVVIRNGILVNIEKELIRKGLQSQLRIAKRSLEKRLLHNNNHFESLLKVKVIDIFVDWDFDLDKSIFLFILNPST
ncbi:Na-translocating system protein MpsC family protein [Halalkalibacter urbisdiaboli]|uniref:Na-translocating system protein MpsC family protein n=1 Tax=Halalkalibacter urbisdiaboli TaxID=1960589 RepID=UPI000B445220|nr:Na-translocating system protein MpsC family protein [Halalkalibacter urbisdiaboli]